MAIWSIPSFEKWWSVFIYWFAGDLYIYTLYINYLLDDCIADIFSHAVACLLTLSGVFSFLILMILIKSNLSIVCHDFMYDFKNIEHASW